MRGRQTISPSQSMEEMGNPFHQNEGNQSPAQQRKVPPQSIDPGFADQKDQQNGSKKDGAEMEFLHAIHDVMQFCAFKIPLTHLKNVTDRDR